MGVDDGFLSVDDGFLVIVLKGCKISNMNPRSNVLKNSEKF